MNLNEKYLKKANSLLGKINEDEEETFIEPTHMSYGKGKKFSNKELGDKGLESLVDDDDYVKFMDDDGYDAEEEVEDTDTTTNTEE